MYRAFCAGYTSRTIFFLFFLSIFVNVAQHLHFAFRVLYDFFRGRASQLPATRRIYVHNYYMYLFINIYNCVCARARARARVCVCVCVCVYNVSGVLNAMSCAFGQI